MTIDIEKLIEDIDEDKSGKIEYGEFQQLLSSSDWKRKTTFLKRDYKGEGGNTVELKYASKQWQVDQEEVVFFKHDKKNSATHLNFTSSIVLLCILYMIRIIIIIIIECSLI